MSSTLTNNYGKVKLEDLDTSLQTGFVNDRLALAGPGQSGFVGVGWNPLGSVKRINDVDPTVQFSVGDWNSFTGGTGSIEGNFTSWSFNNGKINSSFSVSFIGTGLIAYVNKNTFQGILSVSIDGWAEIQVDLYSSISATAIPVILCSNLAYGAHTVKATVRGRNANSTDYRVNLYAFDVLAQPVGKNLLPPFTQWTLTTVDKIVSPYTLVKNPTSGYQGAYIDIPASASTQYTFSAATGSGAGYFSIQEFKNGSLVANDIANTAGASTQMNITTSSTTTGLRIYASNNVTSGTYTYTNPMLNIGTTPLPFETNGYDKVALACDAQWNKSSAFVGGYRVDNSTDLMQGISEITNLVPNATFDRINPIWGTVFQDDFNRANGAVGNGWVGSDGTTQSTSTISSNALTIPVSVNAVNGDKNWTDRQLRFSFVFANPFWIDFKWQDSNNFYELTFQGTTMWFNKKVNGVVTGSSLNAVTYTALLSGTTYYFQTRSQGNIHTATIYSDSSYTTVIATTTMYADELQIGRFSINNGATAALTIDSVVVTAPFPDGWAHNAPNGSYCAYYGNGVWAITNQQSSVVENMYNSNVNGSIGLTKSIVGQTYTARVKRKIDSYTSGNGINVALLSYDGSFAGTFVTSSSLVATVDSDWVEVVVSGVMPASSVYVGITVRCDAIAKVEMKEPMVVLGSYSAGQIPFHTKESRCDLICLQNDGQVITTQGTGASELGYRVETEDGSISTFLRDKRTVQHWDRVKVWKSGTWGVDLNASWQVSESNGTEVYSNTANDVYYISFVGTGIDIKATVANNNGIAAISIDGGTEWNADMYSPNPIFKQTIASIRNLPYGQHTVKIRVTGTKNTLAVNTFITIDVFDIYVPAIPMCPSPNTLLPVSAVIKADPDYGWIRYDDSESVLYNNTWNTVTNPTMYNNGERETQITNDYAEINFVGNGFRWITYQSQYTGIWEAILDGTSKGNIDMYFNGNIYQNPVYTLQVPFGLHTLRFRNTGTKNASALGAYMSIDAFDVKNTMYVIDLRKNQSQVMVEAAITTHEAKDLWDAHPQALKGDVNKIRIERGNGSIPSGTNFYKNINSNGTKNFSKAFTVPPQVYIQVNDSYNNGNGYTAICVARTITTTGFDLYYADATGTAGVNTTPNVSAQALPYTWVVIGY